MQPGRTCLSTSKDITIVSGCIPPSGISPPNRQSAKPLDPVSTKSGEGHGGDPSQTAGNRQLPAGSYEHRRDGVKIVSDGDSCCSHAMSVPDSSLPGKGAGVARPGWLMSSRLIYLPASQTVSHRIFISSHSDWRSTYHTSNLNFFGQVSALRPLICAQPVIPAGTSCRRICSVE